MTTKEMLEGRDAGSEAADIDAPIFTDAAGVEWSADRWSPKHPWMLTVSDKINGQLGFSLIIHRGDIDCLPPAADRAEVWAKIQAFAKANPPEPTATQSAVEVPHV